MKKLFTLLLLMQFLIFTNCKKESEKRIIKKTEKSLLQKIDSFDIEYWSARTGNQNLECINYENDSVYYRNETYHIDYEEKSEIAEKEDIYINGKKYIIKTTPKTKDSIVKLYNLKKFEFKAKKTYQDHFEFEDCILKRKIKMDSGSVNTLQAKNGATFQVIDVIDKPICLQVCYQGKTYKEKFLISAEVNGKLFIGNGHSRVVLYDLDKDKQQELLVFINRNDCLTVYAYKINLPN